MDNNTYLEIMNALNEGDYNKAYYNLLFNDFINKGKWVHEKDKLKSEKQIRILKKFNGWYCTGK